MTRQNALNVRPPREVFRGLGGFGGEALPLMPWQNVVAELERLSIDRLPRQTAVPDEVSVLGLDDPQPQAVPGVVALVPVDPALALAS